MVLQLICLLSVYVQLIAGLQIPVIGDYGDNVASGVVNQQRVADQLANWCDTHTCQFIIGTGDNFYPQGVTSPTDARFDSSWKNVYYHPSLVDKVWYQSIGNHDHDGVRPGDGREWNQVLYSNNEPRWYFPDRWYDWTYQDPEGFSVHFVVIDTQSLRWGINNPAAQLQWLDDTLAGSSAEWRVVIAHHPPYSAGNYGPGDATITSDVVPILKRNKVQLLLSGHDHNLQHIGNATNPNEIDYIVSGGGGRGLYNYNNNAGNSLIQSGFVIGYFGFTHGFNYLEFSATSLTAHYVTVNGDVAYSFTRGLSTEPSRG